MTTVRDQATAGQPASWELTKQWLEEVKADRPAVGEDSGPLEEPGPAFEAVDLDSQPPDRAATPEDTAGDHDEPAPDRDSDEDTSNDPAHPELESADDGWLSGAGDLPTAGEAPALSRTTLDESLIQQGIKLGGERSAPRFNKKLAAAFGGGVLVIVATLTLLLMLLRSGPSVAPVPTERISAVSIAPATPETTVAAAADDTPIPFTAQAQCPIGSTTAQAAANDDPTQAWVCVRDGVDGQVIEIQLGRPMVITAVSLTPWVGTDSSGAEQWLQHRVVTRAQWLFNTVPPTTVTQNTQNVHGEAVQTMPERGVLASSVTLLIQETSRPPADTPPEKTAAPDPFGGILPPSAGDSGMGGPSPTGTDPADTTVAISNIKIIGHPPL